MRKLTAVLVALAALACMLVASGTPAAAASSIACLPANGLSTGDEAKADRLMAGYLTIPGYGEVYIGTSGNVNWGLDPFANQSWRRYFLSLKWVELLTMWYQRHPDRHAPYLARAKAIAADFAADNPAGGGPKPVDAWVAMYAGQRATVYTCIESITPGLSWVRSALLSHGGWLHDPKHDPGAWNQGVDTYIGLMAAGCTTGTAPWQDHASQRLAELVPQTIAADGAVLEQAPGYGSYLYDRWKIAADVINQCGRTVPAALDSRLSALMSFLAWATLPDGTVAQIGDSFRAAPKSVPGTPTEYVTSGGASGTPPAGTGRTFSSGYAFARDSWSPYASSTYFALRFGPGRVYHGHDDHQSVLLSARSHPVLVDGGHYGYTAGSYRDYLVSAAAHNVLTIPGVALNRYAATTLTRSGSTATSRWYEVTDTAYGGRTRARSVLIDTATPLVLVYDRASRASAGSFQQLWHLPVGTTVAIGGRSSAVATSADKAMRTTLIQLALPGQALPAGATGVITGQSSPVQGWVSYTDRQRTAAPTVLMNRSGTSAAMISVVVPTAAATSVSASVVKGSDGWYRVTVNIGGTLRVIRVSPGGALSG